MKNNKKVLFGPFSLGFVGILSFFFTRGWSYTPFCFCCLLFLFVFLMLDFSKLPIDVYHVIHQYLLNYDHHEFLKTSKALFSEVKYRTMHYHLRCSDRFDQADAGIISEIVTSRVMNKSAQVFITFKFDCQFYEPSVVKSPRLSLQIPIDVHTLKIRSCYHPDNLCFTEREGSYLHTLEICGNGNEVEYDFSSVSATFPCLHKLTVRDCRIMSVSPLLDIPHIELTDVVLPGMKTSSDLSSAFHDVNLHQIHFHYAVGYPYTTPLISTLSAFKDVQNLSLKGDFVSSNTSPGYSLSCHSLTLINLEVNNCFALHLKTPKRLSLSGFDLKTLTIDNVAELEEVSLCGCSNVDMTLFENAKKITIVQQSGCIGGSTVKMSDLISFQFLSHIILTSCDIVDVSLFSYVHSVELKGCKKLTSLQGLGKSTERGKRNHHVMVTFCDGITDFSPLNGLHRVHIFDCSGFRDGNEVKDVINLILSWCFDIESFHMFGNVYSLRIDGCRHLATLSGLQDVPYLRIVWCENLKDIKGLKNNQYVEIEKCRWVYRELESYKTDFPLIPHFTIT
jgi:hypothetical protein